MTEALAVIDVEAQTKQLEDALPERHQGQNLINEREWAILAQIANTVYMTEFVPSGIRGRKEATLACLLYGREQNLGPMTAMAEISMIDGKPSMSSALMLAKIRDAGHRVEGETSATGATVTGTRKGTGEQMTFSFTREDAERAKLLHKDNWTKYPQAMYWARAVSALARFLFSDVFIGSVYTPEELGAEVDEDERPILVGSGKEGLEAAGDAFTQEQPEPEPEPRADHEPDDPRDNARGVSEAWMIEHAKVEEAIDEEYEGRIFDLGNYTGHTGAKVVEMILDEERVLPAEALEYIRWYEANTKGRKGVLDAIHKKLLPPDPQHGAGEGKEGADTPQPQSGSTPPTADDAAPGPTATPEPAPSFQVPASARLRVERVTKAMEIAHDELGQAEWSLPSVLGAATKSFDRAITAIEDMSDGELDSIWKAIPQEVRERVAGDVQP